MYYLYCLVCTGYDDALWSGYLGLGAETKGSDHLSLLGAHLTLASRRSRPLMNVYHKINRLVELDLESTYSMYFHHRFATDCSAQKPKISRKHLSRVRNVPKGLRLRLMLILLILFSTHGFPMFFVLRAVYVLF